MKRVLFVSSIHRETGNATARELTWLLGRLRPDVLFLEDSSTDRYASLEGSCGTPESAAVVRYRNVHPVELVAVDLHLPTAELKPKFDDLFDRIVNASPRYRELELANLQHTAMGGFAYLNSPTGALLHSEMQREMRTTVEAVARPGLAELYALWVHTNELRELAMINAVEAFAKRASFKKAVLLVGAGHRQSLLEKSRAPRSDGRSSITWEFDWELDEADPNGDAESSVDSTDQGALS
jgi:hypothetical protein